MDKGGVSYIMSAYVTSSCAKGALGDKCTVQFYNNNTYVLIYYRYNTPFLISGFVRKSILCAKITLCLKKVSFKTKLLTNCTPFIFLATMCIVKLH